MEILEDISKLIVPLIFAAIYFFGNKMSEQKDESEPRGKPSSSEDVEAAERQRRIQEEIRRKIMERRQAAEGGGTVAPAPAARGQASAYDEQLRKRREAMQARRQQAKSVKEVTPPPIHREVVPPPIEKVEESNGRFSWDESDNAYESQMEQQLKQIEVTKRRAEQLKKQVAATPVKSNKEARSRSRHTFSGSVRSRLKDPAAARAAFIYSEVLGQPVSTRKQSSVPGLS